MTEARAITFAFSRLPAIPCSIPTVRQPHRHCHRMFLRARRHYDSSEEHYQKNARKYWDNFYRRHKNKFFKDRHYLVKDWGSYFAGDSLFPNNKVVLEVGCGAGNTIFPLLASYPNLYVHACDFSAHAIDLVKSHPDFKEDCLNAFVCDVIHDDLSEKIESSSIDIVTLIFTMSAVSPKEMPLILRNIKRVLKPTGYVLLRDYAVGDFAQVKLQERKQMINENFYVRGDGTCSFYFSESFLSTLFSNAGFQAVDIDVYCKRIENRSMFITMDRRWIRAIFKSSTCIAPDSAFSQELDDCLDPQIG